MISLSEFEGKYIWLLELNMVIRPLLVANSLLCECFGIQKAINETPVYVFADTTDSTGRSRKRQLYRGVLKKIEGRHILSSPEVTSLEHVQYRIKRVAKAGRDVSSLSLFCDQLQASAVS